MLVSEPRVGEQYFCTYLVCADPTGTGMSTVAAVTGVLIYLLIRIKNGKCSSSNRYAKFKRRKVAVPNSCPAHRPFPGFGAEPEFDRPRVDRNVARQFKRDLEFFGLAWCESDHISLRVPMDTRGGRNAPAECHPVTCCAFAPAETHARGAS